MDMAHQSSSLRVSVPLRGYGFEIFIMEMHNNVPVVSVPLRGYGFEILLPPLEPVGHFGFPSPWGFLLLSFPRLYGGSGEQREPMGALVACVHF